MAVALPMQAQETSIVDKRVGVDVFKGFIFKHKEQINHLITDHPVGFRVSIDRKYYGDQAWQQRFNYPDAGITLVYLDYKDSRLGKSLGAIPHYNFYFRKKKEAPGQLKLKTGLGLGYNTNKYHREDNNKNNALSTDINFGMIVQAEYERRLSNRLFFNTSIAFTHFSNGSIKKPNSGINVVSLNTGIAYSLHSQPQAYQRIEIEEPVAKNIGYAVSISTGMHEYSKIGSGSKPFWVVSGLIDRRLNAKSALGIALEWFASLSMKHDIKYDYRLTGQERPDWHRIGLALSHELFISDLSVISQAGYYLYDDYDYYGKIYFRMGLRKYYRSGIFNTITVKSHGAKAEAAEFVIGYRIK